ncbi:MAG: hypothetical protein OEV59_01475 [Deltaproteobacteria bacterium]|nr:hypothetical protein [Deltaproteobacteria bacterium]
MAPGGGGSGSGEGAGRAAGAGAVGQITVTWQDLTTLATGTDPGAVTIAPGAAATDVDAFTLQTNSGTETISSVTVNLSTNSGIGTLAITNSAGGTVYGSTTSPVTGSNTITVTGMSATTTLTTFKVRVTPMTHALMPVPPGASYSITAPVTAWVGGGTHSHTGSDTNATALTIDNLSPNGATAVSGSASGNNKNTINWTTSNSADFNATSGSVVLRWAAAGAGSDVPVEGTTYAAGNAIGTATVACVISSTASAAQSKIDGTGGSAGCTAVALTTGQPYTYKVFQKDTNGNYDAGVTIGTFTPTQLTVGDGVAPANKSVKASSVDPVAVSTFTLKVDSGTDTAVTIAVTRSGTSADTDVATSGVQIYQDNGTTANEWDASDTLKASATLATSVATFTSINLPVTTTQTQYLITIKTSGTTATGDTFLAAVTSVTGMAQALVNSDNTDATVTTDATLPVDGTLTPTAVVGACNLTWATFSDANSGLHTTDAYKLMWSTAASPAANCTSGTEDTNVVTATATPYAFAGSSVLHYFRICAIDNAGNVSAGATASCTPQVNAAPVTSAAPVQYKTDGTTVITNNTWTTENQIIAKGTATDANGHQYKLEVEIIASASAYTNTANCSSGLVNSGTQASTGVCTAAGLANGNYKWQYRWVDSLGAASTWTAYNATTPNVKIDTVAPSTTDNASATWTATSPVTVTLTPTDATSGVASTKSCLDAATPGTCTPTTVGTAVSVTCAAGSTCTNYVRYFSTDNAGNNETTKTSANAVRQDKEGPKVASVDSMVYDSVTVTFTETGSGLKTGGGVNAADNVSSYELRDGSCTGTLIPLKAPVSLVGNVATLTCNSSPTACLTVGNTYCVIAKTPIQDNVANAIQTSPNDRGSFAFNPVDYPPSLSVTTPGAGGATVAHGASYNITYTLTDLTDVVTVAFYYGTISGTYSGTAITGACATAAEGTGVTCSFNTTGVSPGTYYIYGVTSGDASNPTQYVYAPGTLTITDNMAPVAVNGASFSVLSSSPRSLVLKWVAPEEDTGYTGRSAVASYDVQFKDAYDYAANLTTAWFTTNWGTLTLPAAFEPPSPATPGADETFTLSCKDNGAGACVATEEGRMLWPNTIYYASVKSTDDAANTSAVAGGVATGKTALRSGWNVVSLPYTYGAATFAQAFGTDLNATVNVYTLTDTGLADPGTLNVVTSTNAFSTILPGEGFYILSYNWVSVLDSDGATLTENTANWTKVDMRNDVAESESLVGNPYLRNIDWSKVYVCRGGTFTATTALGSNPCTVGELWTAAVTANRMSGTIKYWANDKTTTNETCTAVSCVNVFMRPWWGYWVTRGTDATVADYYLAVPKQ